MIRNAKTEFYKGTFWVFSKQYVYALFGCCESSKMSQRGVAGKRFVAVANRNEPVSARGSKQTWDQTVRYSRTHRYNQKYCNEMY